MDFTILLLNFSFLLCPFKLQFVFDLSLLLQRDLSINDLSVESLDIRLDICELVLRNLKFSLRLKAHLFDLLSSSIVLGENFLLLFLSIILNLLHRFVVVSLHSEDLLLQVCNFFFLEGNNVLMIFLLFIDLLSMLLVDGSLSVTELSTFLLLLFLQGLISSSIFEHALRVLISSCLKLLMIFFSL